MTEINFNTWTDCELKLHEIRTGLTGATSPVLFRGQGDSTWSLQTTLERAGKSGMFFADYFRLITGAVRPAVETLTGNTWEGIDYDLDVEVSFRHNDAFWMFPSQNLYRYMVYLRHHGFPSPLLDWSHSPYVAAFFAFREHSAPSEGHRSIYVFCERPRNHKSSSGEEPRMRAIGPYVRTHKRHFRQQSNYTICGTHDRAWRFHPHDDVFATGHKDQDVLWKLNIPSTERSVVMKRLDEYNLNAFSLFDSEEALMETMWLREGENFGR